MTRLKFAAAAGVLALAALTAAAHAKDEPKEPSFLEDLKDIPMDMTGFWEVRSGYRLRNDPYEKDMSLMETRGQISLDSYMDWGDLKFKGDIIGDMVTEEARFDLREANAFFRPVDFMDVKVGRQILTWGTGDLVFINDLFPKDWVSFFIGRDVEYLKAPSDALKTSFFTDVANVDLVITPQFDPDRFISGRRVSYYNQMLGRRAGNDAIVHTNRPDRWGRDSEFAARVYKTVNNYELAAYGYWGFWKSPNGLAFNRRQATFPDLNVYGASIRGVVGKGIGNVEVGYYDSEDDRGGNSPLVRNSEMRYLVGYTQEIGKNLTMGLQYYVEHMMDYSGHRRSGPLGPTRDKFRHITTVRLTKLLMNQTLTVGIFGYIGLSDRDSYLRPNIHYKITDQLAFETGANIFFGDHPDTFFGQFQNNTNIYTAIRYSF